MERCSLECFCSTSLGNNLSHGNTEFGSEVQAVNNQTKYKCDYPPSLKLIVVGVLNCCYVYLKVSFIFKWTTEQSWI